MQEQDHSDESKPKYDLQKTRLKISKTGATESRIFAGSSIGNDRCGQSNRRFSDTTGDNRKPDVKQSQKVKLRGLSLDG